MIRLDRFGLHLLFSVLILCDTCHHLCPQAMTHLPAFLDSPWRLADNCFIVTVFMDAGCRLQLTTGCCDLNSGARSMTALRSIQRQHTVLI